MVFSLFPFEKESYVMNNHGTLRLEKNRNLITADHGFWAILDDRELHLLKTMKVETDPSLFNKLKEGGIIVTRNSFDKVTADYRERFHFLDYGPSLHIIVPTLRCNQKCVYCHSRSVPPKTEGVDMDKETAKKVVNFIMTSRAKSIVIEFQGGECSLNFETVKHVVEYANERAEAMDKRVRFSVVTNLTAMTEEMLGFLKDHKIMGLSTSLDGPKKIHDTNRKYIDGAGTYDDVVYWVKRIKKDFKHDFNLNAMTTITKFSLNYPKEIVDEFVKLGFNGVWLRPMNNLGFANASWKTIGYTAEEYLKFWKESLSYILEVNKKKPFQEVLSRILLSKMLLKKDPMYVDIQSPCGAAIGQLLYDSRGDIFTCDEAKVLGDVFKLGNVATTTMESAITNPTVVSMMNMSTKLASLCDACAFSPYCGLCPVDTYVTQGSIVPKLPQSFRCKVFKEVLKTLFTELANSEDSRRIFTGWITRPL
ncbi:MAG: His-Xaa-Ser system radical SAM maturase HxsB [Candidatus Aenigmatarchaeota archaeon]